MATASVSQAHLPASSSSSNVERAAQRTCDLLVLQPPGILALRGAWEVDTCG